MSKQPEALRMAQFFHEHGHFASDAAVSFELRRLHALNAELLDAANYAMPYLKAFIPCPRDGADGDKNCVDRLESAIEKATP